MIDIFLKTLFAMLSLMICLAIGWSLVKYKVLPLRTGAVLATLENYVLKPALILKTFMTYCDIDHLTQGSKLFMYSIPLYALSVILSFPLSAMFERKSKDITRVYRYAMVFANASFIGYALVPMLLGEEALFHFMLFVFPGEIICNSWGYMLLIPEKTDGKPNSVWKRLFNPVFISLLVGAVLGLTGLKNYIPEFVMTSVSDLGACMSPIAMIMTGAVIADYSIPSLLKNVKVYFASLIRLIALPLLLSGLLLIFGVEKDIVIFSLFAFGTPIGLGTVIVPKAYGGNPEVGVSMTIISDVLCVITIPLLYMLISAIPK